jgi:uncharacterized membrane protein YeiB
LGVVFYLWWPADILHFYGGYMHIAVLFIFIPKKYLLYAAATGQMTLTHYIAHLVLGLIFLSIITGKTLSFDLLKEIPSNPMIILTFAITYFLLSCIFSYLWSKKYKNGPLETLMRKISDGQKNGNWH